MVITPKTWRPALLCGAGIAFAGLLCAAGAGAGETLHLPAGETVALPFEPGSYVAARVSAQGAPVTLELLSEGEHHRRLIAAEQGATRALFMVPDGPALRASGGAAVLDVARVVPPAEQTSGVMRQVPLTSALESPRLRRLAQFLLEGQDTDAFWAERRAEGTPMVEPGPKAGLRRVTFLWRGAQRNVRLWGGPANDHLWLQRLGNSDVWFHTATVPDSLRLSYGFAPDVPEFDGSARDRRVALLATLQADPLNRAPQIPEAPDVFAQISYLALENAPSQPGLDGRCPSRVATSKICASPPKRSAIAAGCGSTIRSGPRESLFCWWSSTARPSPRRARRSRRCSTVSSPEARCRRSMWLLSVMRGAMRAAGSCLSTTPSRRLSPKRSCRSRRVISA